jgi:hypothetical protein
MKGRPGKGRKTKSRSKAAKATRGRSSKSKKASKSRKTSKTAAKRKTARKQAAPGRKKAGRKKASAKTARSKTPRGRQSGDVLGEGNYTASREFRRQETGFVQRNKDRIAERGEQAAEALERSEGSSELRQAEETARAHSAGDGPSADRR